MDAKVDRILSLSEVMAITNLPKATIYKYMKCSLFPKQVRLTPRRVGWRLSQIQEWIDSLKPPD